MTTPPTSKPGSTESPSTSTTDSTPGPTTQTTTCRGDRRGQHGKYRAYTPEELEETRTEMLKISYADIEREFKQACEESKAPRSRRMQ